jgi:CubicO group peptidase (beta-lactamase class C family)
MDLASDRYRAVLSQSIDAPPGARFNCSGGDVALIAAVTARTTRMPIEDYFKLKLFTPLGITKFE